MITTLSGSARALLTKQSCTQTDCTRNDETDWLSHTQYNSGQPCAQLSHTQSSSLRYAQTFLSHSSQNIEYLVTFHHRSLTHSDICVGHSGGMVGTLDAGMSMDVSSSSRPRESSDSMEVRLEVDGWEGWLSGSPCDLVSVSPSSFWSVGPPSSSPSLPHHCHHHDLHSPMKWET